MDQDLEIRRRGDPVLLTRGQEAAGALARRSVEIARRLPALARRAPALGRMIEAFAPSAGVEGREAVRPSWFKITFILGVLAPSFATIVYFAFLASDQFMAETRFAVRNAPAVGQRGGGDIGGALSSFISGSSPGGDNAYIVTSYIRSRAIVDDLAPLVDLRAVFRRPEADFWARLPNAATAEELLDYWNKMVWTYVDGPSGIVTVRVRAFRAEDALLLTRAVIAASEKLVNEVSARARADTMRRAEAEVRRSEDMVSAALGDLRRYRETEGFISPVDAAVTTSKLLLQAMGDKIRMENDLFVAARAMSPNAPTLQDLKTRLQVVDEQIAQLKGRLTGDSKEGRTVSASLVRFEELELKRVFAEKLFSLAQDSLERSRIAAERQNVYVSVFVPPGLPEEARYPERLGFSLVIPIGLLIIWGIGALIAATVEDHRI